MWSVVLFLYDLKRVILKFYKEQGDVIQDNTGEINPGLKPATGRAGPAESVAGGDFGCG